MAFMGAISANVHQCSLGKPKEDKECLYTSFRLANGIFERLSNKEVRNMVEERISICEKYALELLKTKREHQSGKDCHDDIQTSKLRAGKKECHALASLSKLVIRVISIKSTDEGDDQVEMKEYGQEQQIVEECIYLFYDEEKKQYGHLSCVDENSGETLTRFPRDDQIICDRFIDFIQNKFDESVSTEKSNEDVREPPGKHNVQNSTGDVEQLVAMEDTGYNPGPLYSDAVSIQPANKNQQSMNKLRKRAKKDNKDAPPRKKKSLSTESASEQPSEDRVINETIAQTNKDGMQFEVEPTSKFRGRTPGDFDSEQPPRYFADRNGKTFLYLVIPKRYLSVNAEHRLEICIVTQEIDGCSYVHPYFKLQPTASQTGMPNENPRHISFSMDDLVEHSEGTKKLLLQLVVVQHKISELMNAQQPLQVFSQIEGASPITTIYENKKLFKDTFHLHDLRFAATLCKKESGESDFHRCDDIQCISQISTEDRSHKIGNRQTSQ